MLSEVPTDIDQKFLPKFVLKFVRELFQKSLRLFQVFFQKIRSISQKSLWNLEILQDIPRGFFLKLQIISEWKSLHFFQMLVQEFIQLYLREFFR